LRIVLAVVAALTAVLLAHCRHEPLRKRAAFGKLHSFGNGQRWVVPRSRPIIGSLGNRALRGRTAEESLHELGGFLRRKRRHSAVQRQKAGEESIEPRALLRRERRALGQQIEFRRWHRLAHSTASAQNNVFSWSIS